LIHFRTFQLLRRSVGKIAGLFGHMDHPVSRGTMMETLAHGQDVPSGSPLYNDGYATFRENLQDIREYCRAARIPLILGTQVSNLRDQPPFVSGTPTGSPAQQSLFQRLYRSGVELQSSGLPDSAAGFFRSAIGVDSLFADAHYRIARCFDVRGKRREALSEYILARDHDQLRFRTDSRFNDLIRSMEDRGDCFVADIEARFKSLSQDSLIGHNLTLDHLHPTSRGYFIMAKEYARVMRENGLLATRQEWTTADTVDEDGLWRDRIVTDLDERMAAQSVRVITSGWPFKNQSATMGSVQPADTLDQIAHMLAAGNLGWMQAHMQAISFYRGRGDWRNVEWEYKTVLGLYPHILQLYMDLASVYFQQKRFDDMTAILLRSLPIEPTLPAYNALGHIMLDRGDPAGALKYLEKMDDFSQNPNEKLENGYTISYAYARAGELGKARERLAKLLEARPDFKPALQLLADINRQTEKETSTTTMKRDAH
jgi:tetratricopeptide (TPR) repeat protein